MITPEFLTYELSLLETHKRLQEKLLRSVAKRLLKTDFSVSATAEWEIEKLQQSGLVYDEIISEIGKVTGKTEREIRRIFSDAGTEVFNFSDELVAKTGHAAETIKNISPHMKQIMDAALKKTSTEAVNLTKTTAATTQTLYIQAADLAHQQVASGGASYQAAISDAVKFAASQGVRVVYPSGRVSSLDAAMRRSVLTGVNQTAGQLQLMRAQELGLDLMEITAHAGARPDHAVWQGGIVSLSGRAGYLSLDFIGYETVTGFMGANCRHGWHLFWEGISEPAYTEKQLKKLKNHTVTYKGRKYTDYDASKLQRRMESGIRKTKQELVMYDEAMKNGADLGVEFAASASELKRQEAKLNDFCTQTGRFKDTSRTQVFAAETENGIKNFGRSVSGKAVWANKKNILTNAAGDSIIKVSKNSLTGVPNTITQVEHKKGGIDRNYYGGDGRQTKQISNNDHGHPKYHPYGAHGEHAHDYIWERDTLLDRKKRSLSEDERERNSDIL